uniref:Cation-transporting P-type ATPase C-terminal domain-containing protein n=1 Tax=Acrobeloides nanus TaxID=290746 RepID=A0A914CW36_9BILA
MTILLTFGLLNDPMNEAGIRTDLIISKNGFKNIICQSLYQIAVLLVIYFLAMLFIPNVKDGRMADPDSPPSIHYTLIVNTFCLMTLFNALNSRKVYGERNIFQGLNKNKTFCIIWIILFVLQVLLILFGGDYYSTAPLNIIHWGICIAFGVGVLIWGQIIATIRCK